MTIEDIWEEFPPGGCVGSDLQPMTEERMEQLIFTIRSRSSFSEQIQRAQREVDSWPKEKLQNVQLEGFDPYANKAD